MATSKPRNPVIRTSPRFSDLNMHGNIFGGWVLSQMDIAGGITAARRAEGMVATVAIEGMKFLHPIMPGDLVSCYAEIEAVGTTSIRVKIDVTASRPSKEKKGVVDEINVTEGHFIFVAVDENNQPRPVPKD